MTAPPAVYTIWWTGLAVTLVVLVPLAVYLLHRAWRAARRIERAAADARRAVDGIAAHTAHVAALDTTLDVAGDMVALAGAMERKLETAAAVLGERAREP